MHLNDEDEHVQLTGIRKYIGLLRMRRHRYKFPLSFLVYGLKLARYEKPTKMRDKLILSSFTPPYPSAAFDRFIASLGKTTPTAVYISVTNRCEYDCWHCSNRHRTGAEMATGEIIGVIEELLALGASVIGFTGGEPLLRPEIAALIGAVDKRASTVLFTSGQGLTDEKAQELRDAGLFCVVVSLDHFKEAIHNRLRGQDDAFETAVRAIETSRHHGFYTVISTVVTRQLLSAIWEFLAFAKELRVDEVRVLEPVPCGRLINESAILDDEDRQKLIAVHKLANRSRKHPKVSVFPYIESGAVIGCSAGIDHLFIDAEGNVCPCDFTPLAFGNVRTENIKTILERLHIHFDKPRARCFMLENHRAIAELFEDVLPLPLARSIELCRKCKPIELPAFYRKLGRGAD